jgi:hypothetical protein
VDSFNGASTNPGCEKALTTPPGSNKFNPLNCICSSLSDVLSTPIVTLENADPFVKQWVHLFDAG